MPATSVRPAARKAKKRSSPDVVDVRSVTWAIRAARAEHAVQLWLDGRINDPHVVDHQPRGPPDPYSDGQSPLCGIRGGARDDRSAGLHYDHGTYSEDEDAGAQTS